ncbi:MAG: FadR family transcriptional regulator [Cryobacterium sp.]|nr:FadR family transcriptional regulator [Cryobacterium sp.]
MSEPSGSSLARSTLARLRARIASGEWPVGTRIPTEPELSELLGVGRSTVREAIRSLATLGMVETLTARGTFVRSATPAPTLLVNALSAYEPAELIGLRRALDVEAAQSAAAHWTDGDLEAMESALREETEHARRAVAAVQGRGTHCARFHGAIAQASGNRLLSDLDASLSTALETAGLADQIAASIDVAVRIDEHDRLFTAIRGRDVAKAAHHMALHVDAALRGLSHKPVATDLTTLVAPAQRTPSARREAAS